MKRLLIVLAVMFSVTSSVYGQTNDQGTSDTVVVRDRNCMLFTDNWGSTCGDFGPVKLTDAQKQRKMDRCASEEAAWITTQPSSPDLAEKAVDNLGACLRGPNLNSDLAQ